ncbi:MAG: hypothetical protein U9Q06_00995 [Nanoarchaeota archaeon]|nr:hypothetical protein [Nanoarchaeota archaeon]
MKKSVFLIICLLVISVGAFAQSVSDEVTEEVKDYVQSFVEKGGIQEDEIEGVKKIDKSNLPEEVEIKEINENNVGIYEVNYTQQNQSKKIYVVTYSTEEFKEKSEVKNVQSLNFGFARSSNLSGYLDSVNGVSTENSGYVMMRPGSITGISTSLELSGDGEVEIKIYKNGEDTGFSNLISSEDKGFDYDLQSEEVINYNAGDRIAVYVELRGDMIWSNVITLVEITN